MKKAQLVIKFASFSLIEVLLSISLFSIFVMMLVVTLVYGEENATFVGKRIRATQFANEGIEAVRSIKNQNFDALVDGNYGLSSASGKWELVPNQDSQDGFTRVVTITTLSTTLKKIALFISWNQTAQRTGLIQMESYLSNWSLEQPGDWTDPIPDPEPLPDNVAGLKIQTQGNYAYLVRASATNNFIIVDITDPSIPRIKSMITLTGEPTNIAVSGNYAYVSNIDNQQNMQIINISDPANPIFDPAWSFKGLGNGPATGIAIQGNRAYLAREYKMISNSPTFYTLDITNPTAPVSLGYIRLKEPLFTLPVSAFDVYVSGNYAYLASGFIQSGLGIIPYLQVIDISADQPILKKSVTPFNFQDWNFGNATSVYGYGDIVALGQEGPGNSVYIYNVASPLSPSLRSKYNAQGRINDLAFGPNNKFVYVASEAPTQEFQLLNIENPDAPALLGATDLDSKLNGLCYSPNKDRVFAVGDQNNGQFMVIKPS